MRTPTYLRFALPMLISSASAQTHVTLLGEPTRMWTSEFSGTFDAQCLWHETTTYWIAGDTLIDGAQYSVIRNRTRYWESTISAMDCNAWSENEGASLIVREEGQQVHLHVGSNDDRLIYDFTVAVGDSIPYPSNFPWSNSWMDEDNWADVITVDSVEINGTYRKRYVVLDLSLPGNTASVIEGIGGSNGPFQPFESHIGLSHEVRLICVRENGTVIHGEPFCSVITSIAPASSEAHFSIYPNPTSGPIRFEDGANQYEVIDRMGRQVRSGRGGAVDLSNQPTGIYFVRAWSIDGEPKGSLRLILERP